MKGIYHFKYTLWKNRTILFLGRVNSRIKKIYIGALDPKTGSCKSVINMENYKFNHIVEVETGILQEDCEYILKDFFKMLRKMKRRKK